MIVTCPECEKEYDDTPWGPCPHCEKERDGSYQRPPIVEITPTEISYGPMTSITGVFPKEPEEPNTFLIEVIVDNDRVAGIGGSPRAVMWLQGVLSRQKAYLSELADYGRTVRRLNGEVEQLRKELDDRDGLIHKIEREARYRGR